MFREKELEIEKEQQQNYENVNAQGDTEQAQTDLATNVADKAIRREENEKSGKFLVYILHHILLHFLSKKKI